MIVSFLGWLPGRCELLVSGRVLIIGFPSLRPGYETLISEGYATGVRLTRPNGVRSTSRENVQGEKFSLGVAAVE